MVTFWSAQRRQQNFFPGGGGSSVAGCLPLTKMPYWLPTSRGRTAKINRKYAYRYQPKFILRPHMRANRDTRSSVRRESIVSFSTAASIKLSKRS